MSGLTMKDCTMAQAKLDFERGLVSGFEIERNVMGPGWRLIVEFKQLNYNGYLLDAHRKQPRVFKTLDAVISAAEQIGFQVVRLRDHKK